MQRHMSAKELARDERFVRIKMEEVIADPRPGSLRRLQPDGGGDPSAKNAPPSKEQSKDQRRNARRIDPSSPNAPERVRNLMHGIFVGELQALEGAGRTCWDYDVGAGRQDVPFALKLDMARQCWDEARHCEISVKLGDWMGTEIGEFSENTFLFEAACNADPILRLAGVNRGLEGLAIDVFNTMKEFGEISGDPVLEFCEDWMLADEVTHVKMGSDWLRRMTGNDPERRAAALEFQRVVDKLFSGGGFRGDEEDSPIRLARRFRELAGFGREEIDDIAKLAKDARVEAEAARAARATAHTG